MIKVLINNEEVVSNHNLEIKEEMLSTSSTILKNCYPKVWENDKDYVSRFYYPKDYSKCKIYNLPRENTTQEQTGTNLSFETYVGKSTIEDIKFYGNTLQNGTPTPSSPVPIENVTGLQKVNVCGKNLFDIQKLVKGRLDNGVIGYTSGTTDLTLNENSFSFTTSANYRGVVDEEYITIEPSTDYVFKSNVSSGLDIRLSYYDKNKTFISAPNPTTLSDGSKKLTSPANARYGRLGIQLNTAGTITIENPQLEQGSTATSYEPYKGNTYEVNLGKNLWSFENKNVSWGTGASDVKNLLNSLSAGTYTLTMNFEVTNVVLETTNNLYGFAFMNSGGNIDKRLNTNSNISVGDIFTYSPTFTISSSQVGNFTNAYFYGLGNNTNGRTADSLMYNCQLEKGSTATSYSPYFTPIELNKIGDYQDRIYKDNGKWYIEKQIGKVVLDGSEGWGLASTYTNNIRFSSSSLIFGKTTNLISNYFVEGQGGTDTPNIDTNGTTGQLMITIPKNIASILSQFITWLNKNKPEVIYALATPTYTEITNEELINQLESLNIELYEGQTNFIINGSLPMPTYIKIYTNFEELIFCGFTKNTGNVSLNPREFHGVDLQILDFKDLLSTGETLNYVIANKTIIEAINQVVNSISDYGFVVGNIEILNPNEMIGAYSTLNKTAYDVFQYFAEITQSRWTTRLIDENTIEIDFYDPSLMPTGIDIDKTQTFYENYKIIDMSFNYSTNDYRNKQIMTSDEVYANITQTETIIADGYATSFMCQNKIGIITSITLNGEEKTFATKSEEQLGITADFVYKPGDTTFVSNNSISAGGVIVITYYPIVKGREIILNNTESDRIESQINRNGTISRYENRNDTTSSQELQKIGQSYIKYKGNAEINLKIVSELNTWNVGEIVSYNAPINELSTTYMVKSKQISMYLNANKIFYTYNLTSNYNCENAVNYFDNQRAKNQGNIGEGETITRNIDLENNALILFYDTDVEEIQVLNPTSLDFALDGVLI